jgi:L-alanine-DL-glutamate epimerase-like enolase superfamily enzyme
MPGEVLCEHLYGDLTASPVSDWAVAHDGHLRVPDGAGLGFDINLDAVKRYRVA